MNTTRDNNDSKLNENQQRRLRITCKHIDELLSEIEHILHSSRSESPFPAYIQDISLGQSQFIQESIRQFRAQLLRTLAWQSLNPSRPNIPASRAVLSYLTFVDIDAEELKPKYMAGYGKVPDKAINELNGVSESLHGLTQRLALYLRQEKACGLNERLQYLEIQGQNTHILQTLQKTMDDLGLVEFRPRLDMLTQALENCTFEIAVFGKVSTGKSSLLNAMLLLDILPVGINPITAVPTMLRYGTESMVEITYASGLQEQLPITVLADMVTEQNNPGNQRRIARVLVDVPSPRLREGVIFVDTPGLGSLARTGARETLAYLPNCDLALMLISAGSTLDAEDIGTIHLLSGAGIPIILLLSKADLLNPSERKQARLYIAEQLQQQLGFNIRIHEVSTLPDWQPEIEALIQGELTPRMENAKEEKKSSTNRKIGLLRESMAATISGMIERSHQTPNLKAAGQQNLDTVEKQLRLLEGFVQQQYSRIQTTCDQVANCAPAILSLISDRAMTYLKTGQDSISSFLLSEWMHEAAEDISHSIAEKMQQAVKDIFLQLTEVAVKLGSNDHPQSMDTQRLVHDFPRFEFSSMPKSISVHRFEYFLGSTFIQARIRASLRSDVERLLQQTLDNHSHVLQLWAEQSWRTFNVSFDTYTSIYTTEIQRMSGVGITKEIETLKSALQGLQMKASEENILTSKVLDLYKAEDDI